MKRGSSMTKYALEISIQKKKLLAKRIKIFYPE